MIVAAIANAASFLPMSPLHEHEFVNQCKSAGVERARAAGVSVSDPSYVARMVPHWGLQATKDNLKAALPKCVRMNLVSGGTLDSFLSTNNWHYAFWVSNEVIAGVIYIEHDASAEFLSSIGAPADYFDKTGWLGLNYTNNEYGWKWIPAIASNMVWMRTPNRSDDCIAPFDSDYWAGCAPTRTDVVSAISSASSDWQWHNPVYTLAGRFAFWFVGSTNFNDEGYAEADSSHAIYGGQNLATNTPHAIDLYVRTKEPPTSFFPYSVTATWDAQGWGAASTNLVLVGSSSEDTNSVMGVIVGIYGDSGTDPGIPSFPSYTNQQYDGAILGWQFDEWLSIVKWNFGYK